MLFDEKHQHEPARLAERYNASGEFADASGEQDDGATARRA